MGRLCLIRNKLRIAAVVLYLAAFTDQVLALDPSELLQVLGVPIKGLKSAPGEFAYVQKRLGEARRIDTGDAANYEGRVEYILQDLSQSITFRIGECHEGYTVEMAGGKRKPEQALLEPSIRAITAGGLRLGMGIRDLEELFSRDASSGWVAVKDWRNSRIPQLLSLEKRRYGYQKTAVSGDGNKFCEHIWITLVFDASSKLTRFDVLSGGCDDSPCADP